MFPGHTLPLGRPRKKTGVTTVTEALVDAKIDEAKAELRLEISQAFSEILLAIERQGTAFRIAIEQQNTKI